MGEQIIQKYIKQDGVENPFICNLTFDYIEHTRVTTVGSNEVAHVFKTEVVGSTKIYHVDEKFMQDMFTLSAGALRLFLVIVFTISRGTDRIRIFSKRYMELTGIGSRQSFYNAVDDLVNANVLAKYKSNIYWINSWIFFNGDRLAKYPDQTNCVRKVRYKVHKKK